MDGMDAALHSDESCRAYLKGGGAALHFLHPRLPTPARVPAIPAAHGPPEGSLNGRHGGGLTLLRKQSRLPLQWSTTRGPKGTEPNQFPKLGCFTPRVVQVLQELLATHSTLPLTL